VDLVAEEERDRAETLFSADDHRMVDLGLVLDLDLVRDHSQVVEVDRKTTAGHLLVELGTSVVGGTFGE
jgi:hypothetical protein